MLTALGKPDELQLHVRGAVRNGCTVEEVQESAAAGSGLLRWARRTGGEPEREDGTERDVE